MKHLLILAAIFCVCATNNATSAQRDVGVSDVTRYGAKGDGTADDTAAINTGIADAISNGSRTMVLAPGATYRITKTTAGSDGSAVAIKIANATEGFTLDCRGGTLKLDASSRADYATTIRIENSTGVTIKNCIQDWRHLPYTQGSLVAIGPTYADFQLDPNFPISWTTVQMIEEFAPPGKDGQPARWTDQVFSWDRGTVAAVNRSIVARGGGRYRVDFSGDTGALAKLVLGHWYLLDTQRYGANGIDAYRVSDLVIDNFRCYSTAGMCIRAWEGTNVTIKNGSGPRLKPGSGRFRSSNADGTQIGFVRGSVTIDGMYAEASGDDAINVFGVVHDTVAVTTPSQFTLGPTFYPPYHNPQVGDVLQFISPNGQARGTARVDAVSGALGSNLSVVTTSPAPAGFDSTWKVANVSAVTQELVLRNSRFRYIRGRGIVSQAQKNLIIGNRFDHGSSGPILLFFALPYGRQGPMPANITISDNLLEHNNTAVSGEPANIQIFAYSFDLTAVAPAGSINDVTITRNICRNTINMCVFLAGIGHATVSENTFDGWAQSGSNGVAWQGLGFYAVGAINVSHTRISGNSCRNGSMAHYSIVSPTAVSAELPGRKGATAKSTSGTARSP